jgi:hypothetical protein
MFYDMVIWFAAVAAIVEYAASRSTAAALLLILLLTIQTGRVIRNRRYLAY